MDNEIYFICHERKPLFEFHLLGDRKRHEYCKECLATEKEKKGLDDPVLVPLPTPTSVPLPTPTSVPLPTPTSSPETVSTSDGYEEWLTRSPYEQFASLAWFSQNLVDATASIDQKIAALKVALDALERANAYREGD